MSNDISSLEITLQRKEQDFPYISATMGSKKANSISAPKKENNCVYIITHTSGRDTWEKKNGVHDHTTYV